MEGMSAEGRGNLENRQNDHSMLMKRGIFPMYSGRVRTGIEGKEREASCELREDFGKREEAAFELPSSDLLLLEHRKE